MHKNMTLYLHKSSQIKVQCVILVDYKQLCHAVGLHKNIMEFT